MEDLIFKVKNLYQEIKERSREEVSIRRCDYEAKREMFFELHNEIRQIDDFTTILYVFYSNLEEDVEL